MLWFILLLALIICTDVEEFGRNKDPNLMHPQEHFKCDTNLTFFFPPLTKYCITYAPSIFSTLS